MNPIIILASASPRRKQLLKQAEVPFEVLVSDCDESYPIEMPIAEVPVHIATQKVTAVRDQCLPGQTIIGADTIVVIDNTIVGKPTSSENAVAILEKLNGKTHQVITGVCVLKNDKLITFSDTTEVVFNTLTREQLEHYVFNYKPFDKAGAYAIQEWIGVVGIKKINGCFYNVMGLPVSKVLAVIADELPKLGMEQDHQH
jgi:septum formation protein